MDNARDVIARSIVNHESPKGVWNAYVASYPIYKELADTIIAALNASGFEIVKQDGSLYEKDVLLERLLEKIDALLKGE